MRYKVFKFAKSSISFLNQAHDDLKKIMYLAKDMSVIDFDVSCAYRSPEEQYEKYKAGKSTIDGKKKLGMHNRRPSLAVDIYAYDPKSRKPKASYSDIQMSYLCGVIQSAAYMLYKEGEVSHLIRWGGNWNCDSVLITDQREKKEFTDSPHFELFKPN